MSKPTASRITERAVLATIAALPADGSFVELSQDPHAWGLKLTVLPVWAWASRRFTAQLYPATDGAQRLSIQRAGANCYIRAQKRDLRPVSWDELMEVKADLGFGNRWAVEIYPPASASVTACYMRHLWLLPEAPPYAWNREQEGGAA